MGCEVYANGDEIACKAGDNKVIAAMPDVCLSPPSPPAGPIPVPYPNTSFSKDLQNGSKTVMIKGKPVMLKDQSFHKTSPLGDEAATNGLGAGVITHVITGKTYCVAWSMDVKFEGKNVDRHTDLTTSNHASPMPNRATTLPQTAESATPPAPNVCQCCKAPAHSQAQKEGKSMTTDEFYKEPPPGASPAPSKEQRAAFQEMAKIRAAAKADGCGYIFPEDDTDPCSKHYAISKKEKEDIDGEYDAMSQDLTRQQNPDHFTQTYGPTLGPEILARGDKLRAAKDAGAVSIAHRAPRAGGGCPIGEGNLKPVEPKCAGYEKAAGQNQGHIGAYHRKVAGK